MLLKAFGNNLKELRNLKSLTQQKLSKRSGVDRNQISKIENGLINITLDTVNKLAKGLKITLAEIVNFKLIKEPKPFVKWAGGKGQLINELKDYMPKNYNTYYEPFAGGGALFFSVKPKKAVINDLNNELYFAYKAFQDDKLFNKLINLLKEHELKHSENYYYKIRELDHNNDYLNLPIKLEQLD